MMSQHFERGTVPNLRRRVSLEISYTHSVNYEEPIIDEQDAQGSLFQVDNDTYIIAFDSELNGKRQTTITHTTQNLAQTTPHSFTKAASTLGLEAISFFDTGRATAALSGKPVADTWSRCSGA